MWHWEQSNKTQVWFLFIYLSISLFLWKAETPSLDCGHEQCLRFQFLQHRISFLFFFFPSLVSRFFVSDFPEPISLLQWRCILKPAWKPFWSRDLGISIEHFSITHVHLMSSYSIKRIISKPTQKASIFFKISHWVLFQFCSPFLLIFYPFEHETRMSLLSNCLRRSYCCTFAWFIDCKILLCWRI